MIGAEDVRKKKSVKEVTAGEIQSKEDNEVKPSLYKHHLQTEPTVVGEGKKELYYINAKIEVEKSENSMGVDDSIIMKPEIGNVETRKDETAMMSLNEVKVRVMQCW